MYVIAHRPVGAVPAMTEGAHCSIDSFTRDLWHGRYTADTRQIHGELRCIPPLQRDNKLRARKLRIKEHKYIDIYIYIQIYILHKYILWLNIYIYMWVCVCVMNKYNLEGFHVRLFWSFVRVWCGGRWGMWRGEEPMGCVDIVVWVRGRGRR